MPIIECRLRSAHRPCFFGWIDADLIAALAVVLELHDAVDESVDREISSKTDIAAGVPLRAALADDDVAGNDLLAAELLHAAVLWIAVASVSR